MNSVAVQSCSSRPPRGHHPCREFASHAPTRLWLALSRKMQLALVARPKWARPGFTNHAANPLAPSIIYQSCREVERRAASARGGSTAKPDRHAARKLTGQQILSSSTQRGGGVATSVPAVAKQVLNSQAASATRGSPPPHTAPIAGDSPCRTHCCMLWCMYVCARPHGNPSEAHGLTGSSSSSSMPRHSWPNFVGGTHGLGLRLAGQLHLCFAASAATWLWTEPRLW